MKLNSILTVFVLFTVLSLSIDMSYGYDLYMLKKNSGDYDTIMNYYLKKSNRHIIGKRTGANYYEDFIKNYLARHNNKHIIGKRTSDSDCRS